jgi:hypothetical protein
MSYLQSVWKVIEGAQFAAGPAGRAGENKGIFPDAVFMHLPI